MSSLQVLLCDVRLPSGEGLGQRVEVGLKGPLNGDDEEVDAQVVGRYCLR